MTEALEFDWDEENIKDLAGHHVLPVEFEQLISNDPLDIDYEMVNGEDRFRAVGMTNSGRLLTVVWTPRVGRIRAVTAFASGVAHRKVFVERTR